MSRPVALVTGASRGIGRATAIELAQAGFDVAVAARTMHDGEGRLDDGATVVPGGLDTTASAIEAAGVDPFPVLLDLLDRSSVDSLVPTVLDRFGRLDVLVNNAVYQGSGTNDRFDVLAEETLKIVLEGNVLAQLALIRAALPALLESGGGTIVNMISATAYTDPPAPAGEGGWGLAYAMSKAAFGRVTPLLHVEYQQAGLRLFSIDPGFVITEAMRARGAAAQYEQYFQPAGPEVIGRVIRWLASDPAAEELRGTVVLAQREARKRGL